MIIFILDRVSKIYILSLAETGDIFNIYINQFLNFHLIWNTGIGFGLFSFSNYKFYNFNLITFLIILVNFIILIMIFKNKKYKAFLLLMIFGGSLGNLFDRIYYKQYQIL